MADRKLTILALGKIVEHLEEKLEAMERLLLDFGARLESLEKRLSPSTEIQRVEAFNSETVPEPKDNLKMTDEDKIFSIRNALKILPPNLEREGRHSTGNVSAICGFKVSEDQITRAYGRV